MAVKRSMDLPERRNPRRRYGRLRTVLAVALVLGAAYPRAAEAVERGAVTISRVAPQAVLVWDATPLIAEYAAEGQAKEEMQRNLEAAAIDIIGARLSVLSKADRIRVLCVYRTQDDSMNRVYGAAGLTGVMRLFTLSVARSEAALNGPQWASQLREGVIPSGVDVAFPKTE
jgi:hypothetical protein